MTTRSSSRKPLNQLLALLTERSVQQGEFTLSSGRSSTLYVDARVTTMSPDGLALIGPLCLAELAAAGWDPDSVGGLTLGADPISYAISYASSTTSHPIRAFTVRKTPKIHGAGKEIEGPFDPSDAVVITEDVVTTGASTLKAIEAVRRAGARILGVLALVDREEGGREALEQTGVPVRALITASAIMHQLRHRDLSADG
jgi:orotate phosphoribosyltransferase